jgi:leucyl/phenylalanyl-tRNA--protein transferase
MHARSGIDDLDPLLLLNAYAAGIFPMADSRDADDLYWVEPTERAIIPLDQFHVSRSLRSTLRSGRFLVTRDRAFAEVVRRCADRAETWINPTIERAVRGLHRIGRAHSIEAWSKNELVGGLYGVRIGTAFFGESMFSSETDASKVALAWLVARMKAGRFTLLDCQLMTDHLRSLGAIDIPRADYSKLLSAAVASDGGGGEASAGVAGDFGALDDLIALAGAAGAGGPSGKLIAQLLTQTS